MKLFIGFYGAILCLLVAAFVFVCNFGLVKIKSLEQENDSLQNKFETLAINVDLEALEFKEDLKKKSEKILLIEESLDPANTRWAKIKQVRSGIKTAIDQNGYRKYMSTTELTALASAIVDYSEQYDVSVALLVALIQQESAFNPRAKSHAGALGLTQIIPSTAREIAIDLGVRHYSMYKVRDSVRFGAYYLTKMIDEFDGDISLAVRAYNCGPTYVHKVLGGEYTRYPEETINYVKLILGNDEVEGHLKYYEKMGL